MSATKFADSHNMVAFFAKPTESDGFEEILNFLNVNPIKYALTVNPIIYTSCIEQFWATAKVKTVNREVQLQALVDGKKVIITKTSVRRDLQLKDAEAIECLPNADIFEQLALIGMVKNVDSSVKFLMYPRFVQVFLDKQVGDMSTHDEIFVTPSRTKKPIADEAANEENVPTHSNDLLLSGEDRLKLEELMTLCTNLQNRVLDLEHTKSTQALEIESLKRRVNKLEKKQSSRTSKLKRLFKGRKITNIDQDAEVTLVDETQGRYDDAQMFDTNVFNGEDVIVGQDVVEKEVSNAYPVTTAGEVVTTASVEVSAATTTTTTAITESTTTTAPSTIPKAKSITFRDLGESTTRTTLTPIPSNIKDKGKSKMIEPEKPLKKTEQIRLGKELAFKLQAKQDLFY
ncbi:hypothetical protein Tco_1218756 [Tanacetum coccineum]